MKLMDQGLASGQDIPRLVVNEEPKVVGERVLAQLANLNVVGALLAQLADSGESTRVWLRSLLRSLIEEGRSYSQTPDGRRWAALLEESPTVNNGWLLWNHANLDFYLSNSEPLSDHPSAMLTEVFSELSNIDIADMLTQITQMSAVIDVGVRAPFNAEQRA